MEGFNYNHETSNHAPEAGTTPAAETGFTDAANVTAAPAAAVVAPALMQVQAAIAADVPEEVKALRLETDRVMFGDSTARDLAIATLPQGVTLQTIGDVTVADGIVIPHAEVVERLMETGRIVQDLGATGDDWQMVCNEARASPETKATWEQETARMLIDTYGAQAQERLNEARVFVARDSRVGDFLDTVGLGNNPRVVAKLIELARSAKGQGRLK